MPENATTYTERKARNMAVAEAAGMPPAARRGVRAATDDHDRAVMSIASHPRAVGGVWWVIETEGGAFIVGPRGGTTRAA